MMLTKTWPDSGNPNHSSGGRETRRRVDPKIKLSPYSTEADSSTISPQHQRSMSMPQFLKGSKQPQAQQAMTQQSWKQSVMSSWRNRGSGTNIDASDRTAATTESSLQGSVSSLEVPLAFPQPIKYADLLSCPVRKISFVMFNDGEEQDHIHNARTEAEGCDATETMQQETGRNCPNGEALFGVELVKNPKTKQFEVKDHCSDTKNGAESPFLSPELAISLLPGDALESINGMACRRFRDVNELYEKIAQQRKEQDTTTLTFVRKAAEQPDLAQQQQSKQQPIVHQVTFITHKATADSTIHGVGETQQNETVNSEDILQDVSSPEKLADSTTVSPHSAVPERLTLKTTNKKRSDELGSILRLESISSDSWLHHTCARANDVVLAINTIPCYELDSEDANLVLKSMAQTHPYVTLKFYSPPLTRRESIRRAAVATAGGTMVGAGAIMMVTPLHPIGHAMAIGGLGVLGTEFEGPKKAFTKMGDVVRRRSSAQEATQEHKKEQTSSQLSQEESSKKIDD